MATEMRNILFYSVHPSYDFPGENDGSSVATDLIPEKGKTTAATLLSLSERKFSKIVLLHRPVWTDLAKLVGARLEQDFSIDIEYLPIPSIDVNTQEEIVAFYYKLCTAYPFNYTDEEYFIFSSGLDFVSRIYIYYLTTMHFLQVTVVTLPYATEPGKAYFITPNIRYYAALSEAVQIRNTEALNRLKGGIETKDVDFNRKMEQVEILTLTTRDPILLSGPPGTGKSTLARRIYELRRDKGMCPGKFVEVNCSAIREEDAHSLLFGHVPGTFPGTTKERAGLLRTANKGMVYLADIGKLGAEAQEVLLRALDEGKFYPRGSDELVESDFMLVCSTEQNLMVEAHAERFRMDLLAKINLWHISMPSLRERSADLPPNLDWELEQESKLRGVRIVMTPKARERFLHFAMSAEASWESNFRSFSAIIRRMCTFAPQGIIDLPLVEDHIWYMKQYRSAWEKASDDPVSSFGLIRVFLGEDSMETMDYFDACQLESVLSVCLQCRNLADAGRRLFSHSRLKKGATNDSDRIRKYLARYNLTWSDITMMRNQGLH